MKKVKGRAKIDGGHLDTPGSLLSYHNFQQCPTTLFFPIAIW